MQLGIVIDLKRCIGCYGCQVACKAEHATRPGTTYARLFRRESGSYPEVRRLSLPLLCMHCREAPCVEVCPTGASQKRLDGIVFVDAEACVGCRACMMACPFGARYFQDRERSYFGDGLATPFERLRYPAHQTGVVEKCDLCRDRLDGDLEPACVANCMCRARVFGDLDDPDSEVSRLIREKGGFQLNAELGTDPSVYYLPADR